MRALLMIDVQNGFLDPKQPIRNNKDAESNMLRLMEHCRQKEDLVIHIQQLGTAEDSFFLSEKNRTFQKGFGPQGDEKVIQKFVNSAFIGTDLEEYLHQQGIHELIIAGLTLPHCVSTTTRMAANLGFDVILIEDACATYALRDPNGNWLDPQKIHLYNLVALNHDFAKIMTTQEFLDM